MVIFIDFGKLSTKVTSKHGFVVRRFFFSFFDLYNYVVFCLRGHVLLDLLTHAEGKL